MIRFATKNDFPDIITLWNEAFGDSEREILFFLDYNFSSENTLVYELNHKVVSMLFLLEGDMILNGIKYPSYYLYAACTAESCRGRGIMAQLLQHSKTFAEAKNKYFICLMPGEKSLFDFYEKFGYKTIFTKKVLKIKSEDITDLNFKFEEEELSDNYFEKRLNAFGSFNRFEWNNRAIQFACKHHLLYGGNIENNREGYLLYTQKDNELFVKEFAFESKFFVNSIKKLFDETYAKSAVIYLPADYFTDVGEFEIMNSAMAVSVKSEYDSLINQINNAYLGLTLD